MFFANACYNSYIFLYIVDLKKIKSFVYLSKAVGSLIVHYFRSRNSVVTELQVPVSISMYSTGTVQYRQTKSNLSVSTKWPVPPSLVPPGSVQLRSQGDRVGYGMRQGFSLVLVVRS